MSISNNMKVCSRCNEEKPLDKFQWQARKDRKCGGYYRNPCNSCRSVARKNDKHKKKLASMTETDLHCEKAGSLMLALLGKMEREFFTADQNRREYYAARFIDLGLQHDMESKTTVNQQIVFAKHDIGYGTDPNRTKSDCDKDIKFNSAVILTEHFTDSDLTVDNIHVFEVKKVVKIIVDSDVILTPEIRLEIKRSLVN